MNTTRKGYENVNITGETTRRPNSRVSRTFLRRHFTLFHAGFCPEPEAHAIRRRRLNDFHCTLLVIFFTSPVGRRERLRSIVMSTSVCLSVCLSVREDISGTTRVIFINFLCMLPMSVIRSSSDMFTIGHIAYRREGVFFPNENALSARKTDGSAQGGRSMLSTIASLCLVQWYERSSLPARRSRGWSPRIRRCTVADTADRRPCRTDVVVEAVRRRRPALADMSQPRTPTLASAARTARR